MADKSHKISFSKETKGRKVKNKAVQKQGTRQIDNIRNITERLQAESGEEKPHLSGETSKTFSH